MTTRTITHRPRFIVPDEAPQSRPAAPKERMIGIDSMRTLANLSVIIGHWFAYLGPYGNSTYQLAYLLMGNLANITAPFFFMVSGYFLHQAIDSGKKYSAIFKKLFSRILTVYLFWIAVYNFLPLLGVRRFLKGDFVAIHTQTTAIFSAFWSEPLKFILEGNTPHLWFLPALIIVNALVLLMLKAGLKNWIMPIGVLAYVVFLMKDPYALIFGESVLPYYVMHLLPSFTFAALGYTIHSGDFRSQVKLGQWLFIGGYALKLAERTFLHHVLWDPYALTCLISTPFISAGAFIFVLSRPQFGKSTLLPRFGKYSLGIYAAHVFIQNKLFQYGVFSMSMAFSPVILTHVAGVLLIYAMSIAAIYLITRSNYLKTFVS